MVFSQNLFGTKIYINPGHGGKDSDDRFIPETGFWESEGNLGKGLALRDMLNSFGASIKMSRTTNNSSDDLGLSVIVADANNFDADYFHSIHSNGFNGKSNYTLILFQGGDNSPTYPEAKIMGALLGTEIMKAHRTTTKYNRGDFDFYGTGQAYLGVFKGLSMPGTLSEGSFHDYIPESWRLRNDAYLKHEAWAIAKAFLEYFNQPSLAVGEIVGIVRDPFLLVNYFYLPGSTDRNKPVNEIKVTLLPDNKKYNGDFFNNGFYLFDELQPGDYKVIIETEGSRQDTSDVIVEAGKTSFLDKYYSDSNPRTELSFVSSFPKNNSSDISSTVKIKIKLDGPISFSSLGGRVSFTDVNNNNVSLKSFDETNYEEGWIIFEPDQPLEYFSQYSVKISSGVKDIYGFELNSDIDINFTIEGEVIATGSLVTSFEETNTWKQPNESPMTSGIDEANTAFLYSSLKSIDGEKSARLIYRFESDSGGVCEIINESGIMINESSLETFGMWIFGDATNNIISFNLYDSISSQNLIISDTLNWTGWKFKEYDVNYSSVLVLNSISVFQNMEGETSGHLYFDNILINSTVTGVENENSELIKNYYLGQNYPNPFNPTTTITYSIPKSDFVHLNVFDLLGRNVKSLVNEQKVSGTHSIKFNADNLSSGIYYYTLRSGNFSSTKKLVIIK